MSGCKNNHWSGNGAQSWSHRNRFEREAENMPLRLRSHSLSTGLTIDGKMLNIMLMMMTMKMMICNYSAYRRCRVHITQKLRNFQ